MMFAKGSADLSLLSGVIPKLIPARVAKMTIHVVLVKKLVVGSRGATCWAITETIRAKPNSIKSEGKFIDFFFFSLSKVELSFSSKSPSAFVHWLKRFAKGTRAKSIITQMA